MDDITELKQKLNHLGSELDARIKEMGEHGVVGGDERLLAEEMRVQHARAKALLEGLEHGDKGDSGRATVAAEVEELLSTLSRWFATTDRDFKG